MRVTRQAHAGHRTAILDAASRLFRTRGLDDVSVAEVSRAAGLTHGAFYGHYPTKSAVIAAASRHSLATAAQTWRARAAAARAHGQDGLGAIVDSYLSESHRDAPGQGCALASIGQELTRGDADLRQALDDGMAGLLAVLAEEIACRRPELDDAACARIGQGVLAALVGGLMLARGIADPARSAATLRAAAAAALAAASRPAV